MKFHELHGAYAEVATALGCKWRDDDQYVRELDRDPLTIARGLRVAIARRKKEGRKSCAGWR